MQFEGLVNKLSPTIKRIAYKLNGHFTFMNHDDLYQEALLHLWMDFQTGRLSDKTDSYILQGCYFHLKNYIRTVQDKASLSSLEALVNDEGISLEETLQVCDPREYFTRLDSKLTVEDMSCDCLTKKEKKIMSLCMAGLTVREIGAKIGVSHVRVIKLKSRIRERLGRFQDKI